jgi:hypothetical protein
MYTYFSEITVRALYSVSLRFLRHETIAVPHGVHIKYYENHPVLTGFNHMEIQSLEDLISVNFLTKQSWISVPTLLKYVNTTQYRKTTCVCPSVVV